MKVMQSNGLLDVGGQLPVSAAVVVDRADPLPEFHLGQDVVDGSLAAQIAGEDSLISLLPEGRRIHVAADGKAFLLVLLTDIHNFLACIDSVAVLELTLLQLVDQSSLPVAKQLFLYPLLNCFFYQLVILLVCVLDSVAAEGVVRDGAGEVVEVAGLGGSEVLGSPVAVVGVEGRVGRAKIGADVLVVETGLALVAVLHVGLLVGVGLVQQLQVVLDGLEVVLANPLQHLLGVAGQSLVQRFQQVDLHAWPSDSSLELRERFVKVLVAEDGFGGRARLAGGNVVRNGEASQQGEQAQLQGSLIHLGIDCTFLGRPIAFKSKKQPLCSNQILRPHSQQLSPTSEGASNRGCEPIGTLKARPERLLDGRDNILSIIRFESAHASAPQARTSNLSALPNSNRLRFLVRTFRSLLVKSIFVRVYNIDLQGQFQYTFYTINYSRSSKPTKVLEGCQRVLEITIKESFSRCCRYC